MYRLAFHKQAVKTLAKMPRRVAHQIRHELDRIAADPPAYDGDWRPLTGTDLWRLRVGSWRAICEFVDDQLVLYVLKVGSRGEHIQMSVQIISRDDKPQYAVVPYEEWQKLQERLEDLEDIADAHLLAARRVSGEEETFPAEFVDRLLAGEVPLKVWREYRGLTLAALASVCGVSAPAISQVESGKREPSVSLLRKLAAALNCSMDDLVTEVAAAE